MGQSTNAILCFGISLEEGYEPVWCDTEYDSDIDDWWCTVNGYKRPFELYDNQGNYIYVNGIKPSEERIQEYFHHKRIWQKDHPLPIREVVHCSGDYPMYIIAVPGTVVVAHRGYPVEIDNHAVDSEAFINFLSFCYKYNIYGDVKWWLCSMWS